jgi:hypothetical protein
MKTLLILGIFAVLAAVSNAQTTAFYYTSSPTSWVGHGNTEVLTSDQWIDRASLTLIKNNWYYDFKTIEKISFDFRPTNSQLGGNWSLEFSSPGDTVFQIGEVYQGTRSPFQSSSTAGLSFYGNGRGDNELTGSFIIFDLTTGANNTVISAAIDFMQYDEGNLSHWNFGSLRYNSSIPIDYSPSTIPEPSTYTAIVGAVTLGFVVWKRRKDASTSSVSAS